MVNISGSVQGLPHETARCARCKTWSLWAMNAGAKECHLVFPPKLTAPLPNLDLPDDCKGDYEEARRVLSDSPRAAAALLRLCTEKVCRHLLKIPEGQKADLDKMVARLVKDGLPKSIQQALDSLRVIGNESVHPGTLDLRDDTTTATKLFDLVNLVVENRISEPRKVAEIYGKLPEKKLKGIEDRDGK